jgi:hypothetical protein
MRVIPPSHLPNQEPGGCQLITCSVITRDYILASVLCRISQRGLGLLNIHFARVHRAADGPLGNAHSEVRAGAEGEVCAGAVGSGVVETDISTRP